MAEAAVCGPDPDRHLAGIRKYVEAGFDHVCVHQIGPDQEGALRFYAREVLRAWASAARPRRGTANAAIPAQGGRSHGSMRRLW